MKKTILFIDDQEKWRNLYEIVIEKLGYNIITVSNIEDAMTILSKKEVDLILLDIRFDESDTSNIEGIYAISKFKKKNPKIEIIMLTVLGPDEGGKDLIKKSLDRGAFYYLIKKDDDELMEYVIKNAIKRKKDAIKLENDATEQKKLVKEVNEKINELKTIDNKFFGEISTIRNQLTDDIIKLETTLKNLESPIINIRYIQNIKINLIRLTSLLKEYKNIK